MSEIVTTSSSIYAGMKPEDLIEGIKKESSKARTRGQQMIESMRRIGEMLIEMKRRVPHGNFISSASWQTNLPERTIQRYMQMAKGVAPHRTVKDRERGHRKENLEVLRLTEFLPDDGEAKPDTVSVLPAPEPAPPAPSPRLPQITLEAEIVEPPATATAPAQAPLEAPLETEVEIKVEEPPAAPVRLKTTSPASPSQSAAILVFEIYKLLPKMSEEDLKGASASLTELVGVIESRWMKGGRP
jgi:hypothetical protein